MLQDSRGIKTKLNRKIRSKRFFTVFILLINLCLGICFSQDKTEILIDLNECKPGDYHLAWD